MLNTLRRRLIVSHVLPLLEIFPLIGIALVYILETQVLLPSLAKEVNDQAYLTAQIALDQPAIWTDPAQAQAFVGGLQSHLTERIMLLDGDGHLLASSDAADSERLGVQLAIPKLPNVLSGEASVRTAYSQQQRAEVVDAWVPVMTPDQQVLGIVRLTHRLVNVYERFLRLRYLVVGILAAGLFLGVAAGWALAVNLASPLRQMTMAISQMASEQQLMPLEEKGPEEICLLLRSFNTLVERLRTLEQNRRQLLASLVHELGRPLGALHSAIQALMGGADRDAALKQELLTGMDEEIGRLRRLLDDLARWRDQAASSLDIVRRPISLSEWLPRVLAPREMAAHGKGLRWQVAVPADLPSVEVDPDRLAQAVGNLVDNAIKYTPSEGVIAIGAGVEDHQVWIRVSDTGPGIAPEDQTHIFTPFYRGRTNGRQTPGMGLGLSIARDLVVAHGGRLEMQSTPGQGSHFIIWLPGS
jgi:two-component system sensor histidine kinase BaeS